ncbi:MAG: RNA polymerase sigma factor [Bacteroidota bacterium]
MSDELLMLRLVAKDLRAAKLLFDRHHKSVFSFYRYMGVGTEDAEDLTQEVFERVFQSSHSFNTSKAFKPWLYQIMRNRLIDFRRKKKVDLLDVNCIQIKEHESDRYNEQDFKRLQKVLLALPEHERELILLVKYQQIKYAEVAEILGISEGAVKARIHRLIKKITKHFNQILQDEGI